MDATTARVSFTLAGVRAGAIESLVLAPTIFVFGVAFGIMASTVGLSTLEALLMSGWVNAGSAQLATLQVWGDPVPLATAFVTTLAMNARYVLLGAALRPWLAGLPAHQSYPSLFVLGDGNWALTLRAFADGRTDAGFLAGSGFMMWLVWLAATLTGHLFGQVLGDARTLGLDFMLAAFFATMAVAFFRNAREATPPLAVAIVTAIVIERLVAGPWYIFAGALAGSLAGAFRR